MATATSSMPLNCSICPKKPDFSDISHLLTHVASKGHLSHYYKIKVRANSDATSKSTVEAYDQWYTEWNVEGLMAERIACKDHKAKRKARDSSESRPYYKRMTSLTNITSRLEQTGKEEEDSGKVHAGRCHC